MTSFIAPLKDIEELKQITLSEFHEPIIEPLASQYDILAIMLHGGMLLVDEYTSINQKDHLHLMVNRILEEDVYISSIRFVTNDDLNRIKKELISSIGEFEDESEISNAESLRMFDTIIRKAVQLEAQDVFITLSQAKNKAYVTFKVEDELSDTVLPLPDYKFGKSVCAAVYDGKEGAGRSFDNFDDSTTPQETEFGHAVFDEAGNLMTNLRIRFTKSTTLKPGEMFIDMRLLPDDEVYYLNDLKLPKQTTDVIKAKLNKSKGMIVTSGPTGSGKTRTLFACLLEFPRTKSIQTFEDPVELIAPASYININQNSIDKTLGYKQQLVAIMRQSPDAILVGEMRDEETANFAQYVAATGHLVLGTIHANNAVGVIKRLLDLGVSASDLASPASLSLIMAQRLTKLLCTDCKLSDTELKNYYPEKFEQHRHDVKFIARSHPEINNLDLSTIYHKNPKGCPNCKGKGEIGRKQILEYIDITDTDREFIAKEDFVGWEAHLETTDFIGMEKQLFDELKAGNIDTFRLNEELD